MTWAGQRVARKEDLLVTDRMYVRTSICRDAGGGVRAVAVRARPDHSC